MGVNATGCAPRYMDVPAREPAGWRETLGSGTHAPSADEAVPNAPSVRWRAGLGRAAAGPPALGDSVIATMGLDRNLAIIERRTGDRLWRKRLNAPGATNPLLDSTRVYTATGGRDGRLFGFELDGRKIWERRVGPVAGPIALVGDVLVAGTEAGLVIACDAATGEVRWTRDLPRPIRAGVTVLPIGILVAAEDSLYVLDSRTGTVIVRQSTPGTAIAPAARQGDTIAVATADGRIAVYAGPELHPLWSLDLGDPVFGGAAIARDSVFAVSIRGVLWRVPLGRPDRAEGVPIGAAVRAAPSPVRTGVLIGTLGGEILLVEGDSVMAVARVEGPIEQPVIVSQGTLFVADGRGRLQAWR